ncbi:hypothetical protein ACE14D_09275 [Streptomyces sp. Act-28]
MDATWTPPAAPNATDFAVRPVRPAEHRALGEISARAYLDGGLLTYGADDPYLDVLRDVARRAAEAEVLVAADPDGTLLGGVTFVPSGGSPWADIAGPDEAEFRVLAVSGAARGAAAPRPRPFAPFVGGRTAPERRRPHKPSGRGVKARPQGR